MSTNSAPDSVPYCHHPHFERAALEIVAPVWAPSSATVLLFSFPGEEVARLVEWAASQGRGLCERCAAGIEWDPTAGRARSTCSDRCRKRKSRASLARRAYAREARVRDLLEALDALDDVGDHERRERHARLIAIRDGTYEPPPRPHAAPRWVALPEYDHGWSFIDEKNLGAHERDALKEWDFDDRRKDKITDAWLKSHDPGNE